MYEKYLKQNIQLDEGVMSSVKLFVTVLKQLDNILELKYKNLNPNEMQKRIDKSLKTLDKVLKKQEIKPLYRDMIRCGVDSALKNLNIINRNKLTY